MRELAIRIRFTTPCLGKEKKHYRDTKAKKTRYKFVFNRSPNGRVVFLPTWWRAIVTKAADVLARHQSAVKQVRFGCEIDGQPEKDLFLRYYDDDKFASHEIFAANSVVGFTCLVPHRITDEDFERILTYAGRYYGISPARPNEYGLFEVESVRRCRGEVSNTPTCEKQFAVASKKETAGPK